MPTTPATVRLLSDPAKTRVRPRGAVDSIQSALVRLPQEALERLWREENLERLARAYWRYLTRIFAGLIRVVYEPAARNVVLLSPALPLLRFGAPRYRTGATGGSVEWPIERGLLVARRGRGRGFLSIHVRRLPGTAADIATVEVTVEVRSFYPWIRGSGRFARPGAWLYEQTQLRIHRRVTHGFLRSLAALDLPPSRIGALAGEIDRGGEATRPRGGDVTRPRDGGRAGDGEATRPRGGEATRPAGEVSAGRDAGSRN